MVTRLIGLGEIGVDSMNESIFQCWIGEFILLSKLFRKKENAITGDP